MKLTSRDEAAGKKMKPKSWGEGKDRNYEVY